MDSIDLLSFFLFGFYVARRGGWFFLVLLWVDVIVRCLDPLFMIIRVSIRLILASLISCVDSSAGLCIFLCLFLLEKG